MPANLSLSPSLSPSLYPSPSLPLSLSSFLFLSLSLSISPSLSLSIALYLSPYLSISLPLSLDLDLSLSHSHFLSLALFLSPSLPLALSSSLSTSLSRARSLTGALAKRSEACGGSGRDAGGDGVHRGPAPPGLPPCGAEPTRVPPHPLSRPRPGYQPNHFQLCQVDCDKCVIFNSVRETGTDSLTVEQKMEPIR